MDRKKFYEERSKFRSMRKMVFSGWIKENTKDEYAHQVLRWVDNNFDPYVVESVMRRVSYPLSLRDYKTRSTVWANSRGTRPVNVKKAGRK